VLCSPRAAKRALNRLWKLGVSKHRRLDIGLAYNTGIYELFDIDFDALPARVENLGKNRYRVFFAEGYSFEFSVERTTAMELIRAFPFEEL